MAKRKVPEEFAPKGEKLLVHPYQLQQLQGASFVRVTNQVLHGRLALISLRPRAAIPLAGEEN